MLEKSSVAIIDIDFTKRVAILKGVILKNNESLSECKQMLILLLTYLTLLHINTIRFSLPITLRFLCFYTLIF